MTEIQIQEKIGMYLPHPQILNFHAGTPKPKQTRNDLRLMMGAGDLMQNGIVNIEYFNTYDVFLCLPWIDGDSLQKNVEYLLTTQKLLCFIDITNNQQVAAFTELFAERFVFIDGYGGHCPHFQINDIQKLLKDGGSATNIYETSENLIHKDEMLHWLDKGVFYNAVSNNFITSRIYNLDYTKEFEIRTKLQDLILKKLSEATQIKIDPQSIRSLPLMGLQHVLRTLMFEISMPLNMTGERVLLKKDWQHEAKEQFVITKRQPDFTFPETNDTRTYIRLQEIIAAIKKDLIQGEIFPGKAKYRTFCKVVASLNAPIHIL